MRLRMRSEECKKICYKKPETDFVAMAEMVRDRSKSGAIRSFHHWARYDRVTSPSNQFPYRVTLTPEP